VDPDGFTGFSLIKNGYAHLSYSQIRALVMEKMKYIKANITWLRRASVERS